MVFIYAVFQVNAFRWQSTSMNALSCVTDNELRNLKIICERRKDLEKVDDYGNTALLKSCYLGQTRSVQMLLKAGANFKAINNLGKFIIRTRKHISIYFYYLYRYLYILPWICYLKGKMPCHWPLIPPILI